MTNAEKFEEVFGIKIDELAEDPCYIADDNYCACNPLTTFTKKHCGDCELNHFWSKEYTKNGEDREDVSKVFALGALFGVVATSDETLELIKKELENMEVNASIFV